MKALAILSVSLYIAFGMQNYLVSLKQGLNCFFFHSFKVFAAAVKVHRTLQPKLFIVQFAFLGNILASVELFKHEFYERNATVFSFVQFWN